MRIIAVEVLPRTAMNKIFKPELRRMAVQLAVSALVAPIVEGCDIEAIARCDQAGCVTILSRSSNPPAEDVAARLADAVSSLGPEAAFEAPG